MNATQTAVTTKVYRVYIKATPQAIWDAITKPEWTQRYGYRGIIDYEELRPGATYRILASEEFRAAGLPEVVVDGEIIEADPPRRLVQTWHALWDENVVAERPTRVTFDIEEDDLGLTRLTVTHELDGAPHHAEQVSSTARITEGGGGWTLTLSDLKTLLETGSAFGG